MTPAEEHTEAAGLTQQVGSRIRAARRNAGLTQQRAAAAAGMTQRHLSAIEAGGQDVGIRTIARLCVVFGITLGTLLDGIDLAPVELASRAYARGGGDGASD